MFERGVHSRVAGRFLHCLMLLALLVVGMPAAGASAQPTAQSSTQPLAQPPAKSPAEPQSRPGAQQDALTVLLFYKTQYHASHVEARAAIRDLAEELGQEYGREVEITETDDAAVFTPENLATFDTLAFAQTGGELFNDAQRAALRGYINDGGGWMGIHYAGWSAGQVSEHDVNDWYLRLVGAVSEHHPEAPNVRPGTVRVAEPDHPLTQGLPASFTRDDEWYDWNVTPAANVRTLLEADELSYDGGRNGTDHPVTWCQEFDGGRSWYTSMGHEGSAYSEPVMRTQLRQGLAYTSGLLPADCSAPSKDEVGEWSSTNDPLAGVTPWPVMPINMALTHDGLVQSFGGTATGCTDDTRYDWSGNDCHAQGGQFEIDVWDPATTRNLDNYTDGVIPNTTYTDLFCAIQVHNPHTHRMMTVGGDDGLGDNNNPVNGPVGVTSYSTSSGLRDEAPMRYPRWYPTASVMPNGDIVVQGGSVRGVAGPGVRTPEKYTPNQGSGWTPLTGATRSDDGDAQNHWWYPRSWVAPENGDLFTISGEHVSELDPAGKGTLTPRGMLPSEIADQGDLGQPIGATSTAVMYRPGKILQVGGGGFHNGGGPDGARAGFTVDITGPGGTANPEYAATEPMQFARHWATSTVLPTGEVLVTGGGRVNNGGEDTATTPEMWNPETGEWTSDLAPHARARLYHSAALLLPDGRIMMGGGGAPGPRNYTDVEFYSPPYLFDGNELAERPEIHNAPSTIDLRRSVFRIQVSEDIDRVALVRNGSVTHSFNNGQNFQELEFRQTGSNVTVEAPADATYAPPGAYMLFAINEDGTPSEAAMLEISPETERDNSSPELVDQFEYPRVPDEWATANPPRTIAVEPGDSRMAPWKIDDTVELIRGASPTMGGLGAVGYHLKLGENGSLERSIEDLTPGEEYRISLRYARDSGVTVDAGDTVSADLSIGSLDTTITATADEPSRDPSTPTDVTFATYVATFTATQQTETLTVAASGTSAGVVIDDLVIHAPEGAQPPDPQPDLPTTTTVSFDPASPGPWGEPVAVTATVEEPQGEPAEGAVELWVDGERPLQGFPRRLGGDGSFTFPEINLAEGEHQIEVRFTGIKGWLDSEESVAYVVEEPPPVGDRPVHYTFDEGEGTTAANSGTDVTVGDATLRGDVGWAPEGKSGSAVDLPGGAADSDHYVSLPDNLTARAEYKDDEFSVSLWANPRDLTNWVPLLQIGNSTNDFFLMQANMQADGCSCLGVTIKAPDSEGERVLLGQGEDLPLDEWTHVVFTMSGSTGKIYVNGELRATRDDFPVGIGDVGVNGTTANQLGSTSWGDRKWNGLFDDVRLLAHELSEDEIRTLFEGGAAS